MVASYDVVRNDNDFFSLVPVGFIIHISSCGSLYKQFNQLELLHFGRRPHNQKQQNKAVESGEAAEVQPSSDPLGNAHSEQRVGTVVLV